MAFEPVTFGYEMIVLSNHCTSNTFPIEFTKKDLTVFKIDIDYRFYRAETLDVQINICDTIFYYSR